VSTSNQFTDIPLSISTHNQLRGQLILDEIIQLMASGHVSLLRAPHRHGASSEWLCWQLKLFALTASGLLEECLDAFSAQYANTPDDDFLNAIEDEIAEDLLQLQSSRSITENYRRFVAITATSISDCDKESSLVRFTLSKSKQLTDSLLCRWNGLHLMTSTPKMVSSKLLAPAPSLNNWGDYVELRYMH
jgi:hypothetical protein